MTSIPSVLFVGWQSPDSRAIYPVGRLVVLAAEPRYEFGYVRGVADALQHGFVPFREMADVQRVYLFSTLPPLFTNRLMPHSRPDFAEHIERLGFLSASSPPAPEVILARSAGLKATDNLEISSPPEFDPASRSWVYLGFARGVRHVDGAEAAIRDVHVCDSLRVERDGTNAWDARALLVRRSDRARLGFVPHVLIEDLGWFLDQGLEVLAEVVKVNLPPAPAHQRLLVKFTVAHRQGFAPMSTPRFQPVAVDATKVSLGLTADLHPA